MRFPLDELCAEARPGLWAGAAAVDITPKDPRSQVLAGFGFMRRARAVRDPLWARCLVLWDGERPLLILALDLIGLSRPRVLRLVAGLTRAHPASVLVLSTHNHQGPDTLGLWGEALGGVIPRRSGVDPAYLAFLEGQIQAAVAQAVTAARPATLAVGQGPFDRAGRFVRNARGPALDQAVRVLQATGADARPIATLIQYACHPETLGPQNTAISADFCGVCCRTIEAKRGGVALYLNGAIGAMVGAALPDSASPASRESFLEGLGGALARVVLRTRLRPLPAPRLRSAIAKVTFPIEGCGKYGLLAALGVVEPREWRRGIESAVSLHQIGEVRLLGLPGEPEPRLAAELLARVGGALSFLCALADDELGYLLPPEAFHDPVFTYETTLSPGPLAAARLALAVERLAREGSMNPVPGGDR